MAHNSFNRLIGDTYQMQTFSMSSEPINFYAILQSNRISNISYECLIRIRDKNTKSHRISSSVLTYKRCYRCDRIENYLQSMALMTSDVKNTYTRQPMANSRLSYKKLYNKI